jgi:hypothetical protein
VSGAAALPSAHDLGRLHCLLAVEAGRERRTALNRFGETVGPEEAGRGEALGCPSCGGDLYLDTGPRSSPRFIHEADEAWRAEAQTALARLALEAVASAPSCLLPALVDGRARVIRPGWAEGFDALRLGPVEDGAPPHLLATKRLRKSG